jgi:hypothetical protein
MLVSKTSGTVDSNRRGDGSVASDRHRREGEEPQRIVGFPIRSFGNRSRQEEEPQRIAGFPVGSIGPTSADLEQLRSLAHPIRAYRRWARRRLGIYATDEDER